MNGINRRGQKVVCRFTFEVTDIFGRPYSDKWKSTPRACRRSCAILWSTPRSARDWSGSVSSRRRDVDPFSYAIARAILLFGLVMTFGLSAARSFQIIAKAVG